MDNASIFLEKTVKPTDKDLADKLDATYVLWQRLHDLVLSKYPKGIADWNFPGKKYGWSYRIKDNRRALIYFLPKDQFFKVAFVFGDKAINDIMKTGISDKIKEELNQAKKYGEGRGIRINIKNDSIFPGIEQLIDIKLKY